MVRVGKINQLPVLREVDFGVYLDGGESGDILLPKREVPPKTKVGNTLSVFIYFDSSDKIIASTKIPKTQIGEFASLKVVDVNKTGAFLDWGLAKDLLVPFREQKFPLKQGQYYTVYTYFDNVSNRIVASTKLDRFVETLNTDFEMGQTVQLLIVGRTDLGYKVIVNHSHWAIVYKDEVFKPLRIGSSVKGYIKNIRPDGKIDATLREPGKQHLDATSQEILDKLQAHGGWLKITDKTAPAVIYDVFGVSKKVFKRSLGGLYKKRLIRIERDGIRLL